MTSTNKPEAKNEPNFEVSYIFNKRYQKRNCNVIFLVSAKIIYPRIKDVRGRNTHTTARTTILIIIVNTVKTVCFYMMFDPPKV